MSPADRPGAVPRRVLVVDDAEFMRSMMKEILARSGRFEIVAEACNGREAVAFYEVHKPDLVTMDIVMPEMDGIEATRRIVGSDPGAVIVICSALGQEPLVVASIAAGARDFVVKPLEPERVLKVIDDLLETS